MSLTGNPDGIPTRVGASVGDITAGLFTTIGILSALHIRRETGMGQKVDVAMLDCQVAILENAIARYDVSGESPKSTGNRHPSITPFAVFKALDGYIIVAAGNDHLWKKWCHTVNREGLIKDSRFLTNSDRTNNWRELEKIMVEILATKSIEHWLTLFEEAGIPSGPINDVEKVVQDPQVLARDMITYQEHPTAGRIMMPGIPIKLSKNPGVIETPAPLLGEHNDLILKGLGYSNDEIKNLKQIGVI